MAERWPQPTSVEQTWLSHSGLVGKRHRGPFTFTATVPPYIASADLFLTSGLATKLAEAASAVTRLNSRDDLAVGALESPLLRSESVGSSKIEGLRASERRVAAALAGVDDERGAAREVANNVAAMQEAIRIGMSRQRLDSDGIRRIHAVLMEGTSLNHFAGSLREVQNWIGPSNRSPRGAEYVPPPPDQVRSLLDDLGQFFEREDIPPIALAAVGHAQFEGIHPFVDGNGRTGRALVHAVLRRSQLAPRLAPPISVVLLRRRDEYFAALRAYQVSGDPVPIIDAFAQAAIEASAAAEALSTELTALRDEWNALPGRPRAGSIGNRILQDLAALPVLNAEVVAERLGVSADVARRGLNALTELGILRQTSAKKRGRVWIAEAIIDLLDAFGAATARDDGDGRTVGPSRHLRDL